MSEGPADPTATLASRGTSRPAAARAPLTRERVLKAAVDVADRDGLSALTMRRLGDELGVEAMSLYKHVASKTAILDGIVELIVGQIEVPTDADDWQQAMRRRAASARAVLTRHSWAIGLMESRRTMGPATLGYLEAMLGVLRAGGFAIEDAAHALWLLDSFVYGHVVHELSLSVPSDQGAPPGAAVEPDPAHPHVADLATHTSAFTIDGEFAYGLDLILDALERQRDGA